MLAWSVNPWLLREVGGLVVLGSVATVAVFRAKLAATRRRASSPRQDGLSERSFTQYLESCGLDPRVAATTYRYLREIQDVRFPILPGDALDWDLGLDEDRVMESIEELAMRLDRQPARNSQLPITVEDLVRIVELSPRCDQAAAA